MIERAVADALEAHEQKVVNHMDRKFLELSATFASAFPSGDPHGHRMAHESQIKQADGWNKLRAEVISKFLTGGLWVAAGWAVVSMWQSLLSNLKN